MAGWVQYDVNHWLLTWGGYMVGGHEQWQCSTKWSLVGPGADPLPPQFEVALTHISISDIYQDIKTWFVRASAPGRYDKHTSLEFAKLAAVGKDGKYLYDPIEYRLSTKGFFDQTNTTPPQLAVVVSLSSGSGVGYANHGRYFLPMPIEWAYGISPSTGMVDSTYNAQMVADQKTMLEAIAGEISTTELPTDLVIMSPLTNRSVKVTAPTHKKVVRIGVGGTVDTQRSRRRDLGDGVTNWASIST